MSWLTGLLSSLLAGIAKILFVDLVNWIKSLWDNYQKKQVEKAQAIKDAQKYEDIINKPDVSREEQSAAEDDLLNRR